MRRVMPTAKKIIIIVFVLIIATMNICAIVGSVRSAITPKSCSDDPWVVDMSVYDMIEGEPCDEPYSGTITKIETTSDNITHIKVESEEGERWFTVDGERRTLYRVGNEVTFRCHKDDPENKVVSVLKNEESLVIRVRNAIFSAVSRMLIPDVIVAVSFAVSMSVCNIGLRAGRGEEFIVPVVVFCLLLLAVGGAMAYGFVGYIRRAEAAAASVQVHAPVIYLYNEDDTPINVKIDLDGEFTYTYPAYDMEYGWTVTASPDGTLTDSEGRSYDFLFWEGEVYMEPDLSRGFCVEGEDTRAFLTDAAATLGLNDNETEFFVSYWAPRMEDNPYNVITFQTTAFDEAAELEITPEPDVLLRVNMLWYPSDTYVDIPEQDLTGIGIPLSERHGFTAVEWGGEMLGE